MPNEAVGDKVQRPVTARGNHDAWRRGGEGISHRVEHVSTRADGDEARRSRDLRIATRPPIEARARAAAASGAVGENEQSLGRQILDPFASHPSSSLMPTPPPPPGPVWSLAGRRFAELQRDRLGFLCRLAREQGDIGQLRLGPARIFLLSHPEHIKDVLVTQNRNFVKGRGTQRARLLLGDGLLTSEDPLHFEQRRATQPAFHRARVASYAGAMVSAATEASAGWRDGETIDLYDAMSRLTLVAAGRTLFGIDLTPEAEEIRAALTDALDYFGIALVPGSELLDALPIIPAVRRFRRARRRLDETISRIIAAARRDGPDRDDVAALLVRERDAQPAGRGAEVALRDELMTLLITGYETMSDTLAWTWSLLAEHPDVEARMHHELRRVLGGRAPTAEDLPSLDYTRMVLAESLRLYPSAYIAGYEPIADHPIAGGWIPRGSLVLMCQYVVHRDARWFPEPERFVPERWDAALEAKRPRFAYFPFGAGPRRCIGEHYAMMEGMLVLATLAQRWRLRLAAPRPEIYATLTLRPRTPMLMRLEERAAARRRSSGAYTPPSSVAQPERAE